VAHLAKVRPVMRPFAAMRESRHSATALRRSAVAMAVRHRPGTHDSGVTVSVVIPCYNYARFLRQSVESVLAQDAVTVDVIVVDDASSDDSLALARELAAGDPRVRVLANEQNLGAVGTFNRGLEHAAGEFLVRLDADDLLTPGSLKRAVDVMRSLPEVGLVYGHPIHFSGQRLPPARTEARWLTVWAGRDWLSARCIDGTNVITAPEAVMRRSVVDVVGGQRALAHTHDMEMWLRVAAHSDVAYVGGADQAWHRVHPDSLSTKAEHPLVILREIRDAFDVLFDGLGTVNEHDGRLRAHAHRAVAVEALAQASRRRDRGDTTDEAARLHAFAAESDPAIRSTRAWRRLARPAGAAPAMPAFAATAFGVLPRARRWLRSKARQRRWHRSGVFEQMRVRPADESAERRVR